jgi:tetratricopeptide (TPR) repeat protein
LGNLSDAADDLSNVVSLEPGNFLAWCELALVHLVLGDSAVYRETCQRMMEAVGPSNAAEIEYYVAWTCCLSATGLDDWSQVVDRARFAVEHRPAATEWQTGLGAALLRAGQLDEALEELTKTSRLLDDPSHMTTPDGALNSSPAYTCYLLAMAHHAKGNGEEARQWLAKATAWTEEALAKHESRDRELHWPRRATLQLLRTEAEALTAEPSEDRGVAAEGEVPTDERPAVEADVRSEP